MFGQCLFGAPPWIMSCEQSAKSSHIRTSWGTSRFTCRNCNTILDSMLLCDTSTTGIWTMRLLLRATAIYSSPGQPAATAAYMPQDMPAPCIVQPLRLHHAHMSMLKPIQRIHVSMLNPLQCCCTANTQLVSTSRNLVLQLQAYHSLFSLCLDHQV